MISKELLSAVYSNFTITEILNNRIDENIYYKIKEIDILQSINIHELAHKCKGWATQQGRYYLYSRVSSKSNSVQIGAICYISSDFYIDGHWDSELWNTFKGKTEPEAIFKACEWILDDKDK